MKKMLLILLALACLLLCGCKAQEVEQPEEKKPEMEIAEPYFTGEVLEIYGESFLAKVTDTGSGFLAVGQEVVVHINALDCPDFAVGDSLTIAFDGKMTCSLPPQVVGVAILVNHH